MYLEKNVKMCLYCNGSECAVLNLPQAKGAVPVLRLLAVVVIEMTAVMFNYTRQEKAATCSM